MKKSTLVQCKALSHVVVSFPRITHQSHAQVLIRVAPDWPESHSHPKSSDPHMAPHQQQECLQPRAHPCAPTSQQYFHNSKLAGTFREQFKTITLSTSIPRPSTASCKFTRCMGRRMVCELIGAVGHGGPGQVEYVCSNGRGWHPLGCRVARA